MQITRLELGIAGGNCYILTDETHGQSLVIDPGAAERRLFQAVEGLRVTDILITHRHFDHLSGAKALKERTGAQVAVHALDACALTNGRSALRPVPKLKPDRLLAHGDTVPFGEGEVRVLHTPGHSAGSVCFLVAGHLFAGDTLMKGSCGRLDLPSGDAEQMMQSLRQLGALPGETKVYPGHAEHTTIAAERAGNPYMRAAFEGDGRPFGL